MSNDNGTRTITPDKSYFSIDWHKDPNSGSWVFHHVLRVSKKYPWLMLYLRADATKGPSGGYPWETRGMMVEVFESVNLLATFIVLREKTTSCLKKHKNHKLPWEHVKLIVIKTFSYIIS